jgi:ketosteroid isomerase-like protein
MRRATSITFAFVLLSIVLPGCALAGAPHKRESHAEIIALERQWKTAQINNDIATMDKLLSDDYLGITPQGDVFTKSQQLDRMRTHDISITSLDVTDVKIKLVGHIAIVTSSARVQGISEKVSLDGNYRYTRVYQHLPSGVWKITNFEVTPVHNSHHEAAVPPVVPTTTPN